MLNDREDERLKKLAEEMAKKRMEEANQYNQNSGNMGFGGLGSMGGLGGSTGGLGGGGLRSNNTSGMSSTTMRR